MARYLALDWGPRQLLAVAGEARRGGARIEQAAAWHDEAGADDAVALGARLRDRLRAAGIAPAPVVACVGRDRIILKEVRYPAVPPAEEPAVVRFQAVKELTHPAEEVVIDYLPLAAAGPAGERRALAVIVRREVIAAYRGLCQAAGLKLAALTLRPWGTVACWRRAAAAMSAPPAGAAAVLTVTGRWGEFTVTDGADLLFTRPIAAVGDPGAALVGEVRRNLTVYASQSPAQPVGALYVAGAGAGAGALCGRLQEALGIPVLSFDPLAPGSFPGLADADRGGFAGAVGLLHEAATGRPLPVNLLEPKEPRPQRDPDQRRLLVAAAAAALVLLLGIGWGFIELTRRDRELTALNLTKIDLDGQVAQVEEDAKRIKALADWLDGEVVWLDELYDLADRMPELETLRLTQLTGQPLPRTAKEKYAARLAIKGITTTDPRGVDALIARLVQDQYYRVDPKVLNRNAGVDRQRFPQQFTTQVDVTKRPPDRYVRRLPAPPPAPATGPDDRMSPEDFMDFGDFGEGRE